MRRPLRVIFAWPILIAALGLIGLIGALTGDGWRDALSWCGLSVPVLALVWAAKTRRA